MHSYYFYEVFKTSKEYDNKMVGITNRTPNEWTTEALEQWMADFAKESSAVARPITRHSNNIGNLYEFAYLMKEHWESKNRGPVP
jgi:hypothetical protein